jgi:hypothetical protein
MKRDKEEFASYIDLIEALGKGTVHYHCGIDGV